MTAIPTCRSRCETICRSTGQTIYREAFNHAWVQYAHDPEREEIAHRVAWNAVERKYRKAGARWVPKD